MSNKRQRRLSDFVYWLYEQVIRAKKLKELPDFAFVANDDCNPHPEQLQRAIAAFDRLPSEEKSAILRGWSTPPASMFNAEELDATYEADSIAPFLCIVAGERHFFAAHEVDYERQSALPVRVMIRAGASGLETLAALRRVIDVVEKDWPDLITDEAANVAERVWNQIRSGASRNVSSFKPASDQGETRMQRRPLIEV